MEKLLDKYYRHPVLYDYTISSLIVVGLVLLIRNNVIAIPNSKQSLELASDIGTIGLTISGFILTLITILISFKSTQLLSDEEITNSSSPFRVFLASNLYSKAIKILQHGVVSLIVISFFIFIFKLGVNEGAGVYVFYIDVVGLLIILSTFLRCYYVLALILKMQK